jgi:glutamate/tyrosine decarboxylase-like PLP-dependent enzyme
MSQFDRMHRQTPTTKKLRDQIFDYAKERMDFDPVPLDSPKSPAELFALAGQTLTEQGLGGEKALEIFKDVLAPATISTDHPNYLSFIPAAPTEAASLFDLVVSASSIYGGSWMEGAGAVFAENQVLSFLASECGLPESAGGVFVQGGTLGNLSALVVAREQAKKKLGDKDFAILCSSESHSSIKSVAKVMGVKTVAADAGESGSIGHIQVAKAYEEAVSSGLTPFAVVGTAGTTNFGILDKLDELAEFATNNSLWFHVDGAYGLAGILSPKHKHMYRGVEHADSFIVDPHKWLYAPFDACALVYRDPMLAKEVHTQHGEYLETLNESGDFNPSDYAFNLTRRVRGLPMWFSLATHGIAAYREAVRANIDLAMKISQEIESRDYLRLVRRPQLSVVVFERLGWTQSEYESWSAQLLAAGFAFVVPSSHRGKPNTRFAIVNPRTRFDDLVKILETMR